MNNNWRNKKCLKSRLEQKKHNFSQLFASKDKLDKLKKNLKTKENSCSKNTLWNSKNKLLINLKNQNNKRS